MKGWAKVLAGAAIIFIINFIWHLYPASRFKAGEVPILVSSGYEGPAKEYARFNVLLLGIDAREREDSRTDAIMLANVDTERGAVNLVSICRDTRVHLDGVGYTKINHAHIIGELKGGNRAGTEASLNAVSKLCKCSINYFFKINFKAFEGFIDTIGGIDIDLPSPVKLTFSGIIIPAGCQNLNGDLTLQLVRERFSLADGDFGRQSNQFLVIRAVFRKVVQPGNIERIPDFYRQFRKEIIDTNLTEGDMASIALMLKNMSPENFRHVIIPGQDGYYVDPLLKEKTYYWIPDLKKTEEISRQFLVCNSL